jgi:transposase
MYTDAQKQTLYEMKDAGASWKVIGIALNKKSDAVKRWYKRNKILRGLEPKVKVSKKITDGRTGLLLKRIAAETPQMALRDYPAVLSSHLNEETPCPSVSTIHKFLTLNGLKIIKLLKKPFISEKNIEKRKEFAQLGLQNLNVLKYQTIWSDETTVRKCPQGKEILHRCHSSVLKENLPVAHQIQQGGFSVMFWGCFSLFGTGPLVALEGSQNQHTYKELLEEYLVPEIEAARGAYSVQMTFMQDNAPCHKTNKVMEFLRSKAIPILDWPPSSPDLNPIENLWAIIKRRRQKKYGLPKTKTALIEQIFDIWANIDAELCKTLAESVENRLKECLRLNGKTTKY